MKKKIILAYSGGLDTTVIIPWLKENQDCEVIAVCVDVGQIADWKAISKRAMSTGASACYVADVKQEYVDDYILPTLRAGAVYEDKYLLGTSTARPLIAKVLVEYARKENAAAIAHGATGKGNDQVRFDLGIMALAPDLEIIAPWRTWKLKSRQDEMRYLARRKIQVPFTKKNSYSMDDNLWHISHEGLELEDPAAEPQFRKMLSMTVTPEKAPNKVEYVEIEFEKGIPVGLNGKKMEGIALIKQLNKIGGANGIGIVDIVENRVVGMKSRGVYETPGGTILYYAHKELEHVCLDRQTYAFKQQVSLKMGELIYGGLWFTPLREALSSFVDVTQQTVSGTVKLKLYKGSINAAGVTSPNSLYNTSLASFTTGELFNHSDAKGFIKLYGLPVLVRSLMQQQKKGGAKSAPASSSGKAKSGASKTSSTKKRTTSRAKK
ncbi:MAG: argininosuccinate synthase [Treponema sp.]|jgi:argininosuccinate synthase|nr:argininosuccinate synthase [Treponema sp.]